MFEAYHQAKLDRPMYMHVSACSFLYFSYSMKCSVRIFICIYFFHVTGGLGFM